MIYSLFALLAMSCNAQTEAENISLHKSYKLSEKPNYKLTEGNDDKDLTDGKMKTGPRFWQDKSTVGWHNTEKVNIEVDLESIHTIEQLIINTARNTSAEVEYPSNCFVFTSEDGIDYEYHGDLMLVPNNISGEYNVQEFDLKIEKTTARFVRLVLISKGKFMFLDEIVILGNRSVSNIEKSAISLKKIVSKNTVYKDDIDDFVLKEIDLSNSKRGELYNIKRVEDFVKSSSNAEILKVTSLKDKDDLQSVYSDLLINQKQIMKEKLTHSVIFTPINGIQDLNKFNLNKIIKAKKEDGAKKVHEFNKNMGYFSLVNNTDADQLIEFSSSNELVVSELLPVNSLNNYSLIDALRPLSNNKVVLKTGENKFFVASSKEASKLEIISVKDDVLIASALFDIVKSKNKNENSSRLSANVWAYLDKPILKENKEWIVNDLEKAGVDVIVVHSTFIDNYNTKDFSTLKSYLGNFKNLHKKKILLFDNFKGNNAIKKFNGKTFLDEQWQKNFKKWYDLMINKLSEIGVNSDEVYYYPYDEIKVSELERFIDLNKWGKGNIPNFKTFVTINNSKSFEAGNYADIVQVILHDIDKIHLLKSDNIWLYDVLDYSRDRNAYSDYRLLAWKAYYYDIKGIGFWNYSALKDTKQARHDKFVEGRKDYSVLYLDSNNDVLSSLRWKSFQQGLADFNTLKILEEKIGRPKTKKMVKKVLDNKLDEYEADKVLQYVRSDIN